MMIFYILLSITEAIQVVAYIAWAWPQHAAVNEQLCLYILFLAACFGFYVLAQRILPKYWSNLEERRYLKAFLGIEAVLTFFLLSALFKLIIYDRWPEVAQNIYHVLLVLLLLNKIFYKSIIQGARGLYALVYQERNAFAFRQIAGGGFAAVIVFLIYLPDPTGVVARIFAGEQFHHWDLCVMGPAFAYLKGSILNVDIISRYGLGMPIVLTYLNQLMGGLSYVHMLLVLMWMCIAYYVTWFFLLRQWLGGLLIPMAAILFGMRTEMLHSGAYPLVFTYPSSTPMRYFFDVVVIFLLWRHTKTRRSIFLYASAALCGFMIFYMFAEGLYLTGAFYTYLLMCLSKQGRGYIDARAAGPAIGGPRAWRISTYFLLVPLFAFGFIFLTQGHHIFSKIFWDNMAEFRNLFFNGYPVGYIFSALKDGNFLQCLMGFIVPLVYMFTILVAGSLWYLRQGADKYLLAVVIAVEGFGLYHYYALLALSTGYYVMGLPYNFLVAFWVNEALTLVHVGWRRPIALGLVAICAWALLTNYNFVSYPNLMNFSRNPLVDSSVVQFPIGRVSYFDHLFREFPESSKLPKNSLGEVDEQLKTEKDFSTDEELKAYYLKETDFSADAKLIQKWTGPHDNVALISSFEIPILMQADRKPFFYYFPLINSRPMRMRMFHVASLYTYTELRNTINSLEQRKPPYLFMERIYLNKSVPSTYFYDTPGLIGLLEYVDEHYEPVDTGYYLVAMRRI